MLCASVSSDVSCHRADSVDGRLCTEMDTFNVHVLVAFLCTVLFFSVLEW